jgi:hypothetical protein
LILDALGQVESMIASNKGGRKEPLPEHVIDELRDTNLVPFWTALGASIKHAGFSQEEEVRLLCSGQIANPRTRLRGSEIVEYLEIPELRGELREPLPLTRIIVGPTEPDRFELVRERISSLLRTNQYPPIPIELSNIPYRGR